MSLTDLTESWVKRYRRVGCFYSLYCKSKNGENFCSFLNELCEDHGRLSRVYCDGVTSLFFFLIFYYFEADYVVTSRLIICTVILCTSVLLFHLMFTWNFSAMGPECILIQNQMKLIISPFLKYKFTSIWLFSSNRDCFLFLNNLNIYRPVECSVRLCDTSPKVSSLFLRQKDHDHICFALCIFV